MARPDPSLGGATPRTGERVEHSSRDRREYVPAGCVSDVLSLTLPGRTLDTLARPRVTLRA